jgi:hypothetical protein
MPNGEQENFILSGKFFFLRGIAECRVPHTCVHLGCNDDLKKLILLDPVLCPEGLEASVLHQLPLPQVDEEGHLLALQQTHHPLLDPCVPILFLNLLSVHM